MLLHWIGQYPLYQVWSGSVPGGKPLRSTEARILVSGFRCRPFDRLYHSLTDEVTVAARLLVAGCVRSSVRRTAVVGPQVLDLKSPLPRNCWWYQGHRCASGVKAETWKTESPFMNVNDGCMCGTRRSVNLKGLNQARQM